MDWAIEQCQLGGVRGRLIGNLSKGFRQRVGIAQAILHEPEVLILDEPTIGLDPKQVTETRNLIKSFRGKRTLIYSTHILSEVAATCDRIIVIDNGRLVAQESLTGETAIGRTVKTELVLRTLNDELINGLKEVRGVKDVKKLSNGANRLVVESEAGDELLAELAKTVVSKEAGLIRMSPVQLALEEYYLDLISGGKRSVS